MNEEENKKKQSIARKELSRTEENGLETVKNIIERFEFDDDVERILADIFDDYEYAQDNGLYFDAFDAISYIEVDKVLKELREKLEQEEDIESDDELDENYIADLKTVINYLNLYTAYTIWV
jgi:hypothetical protein